MKKNPVLFFLLLCSQLAFSQLVTPEKILSTVKAVEASWNATSPDKSYLSAGHTMQYGLDYLKAGNYSSASWSFEELLAKNANDAYANFFMGCVKLGLNDQAAATRYLDKAVQLNPTLKDKAADLAVVKKMDSPVDNQKKQTGNVVIKQTTTTETKTSGLNHYKVGDKVEVSQASGWWPGVVTKVEGEDKNVYVAVDYTFQQTKYKSSFFYNGIRPATGNTTVYVPANKPGGPMVYGDYTLTRGIGANATRIGYFTIYANGTYVYFDVKGTYSYNSTTGDITWKSGTFFDWGKNTSRFTRGKKTSQIDMTYPQKSGPLYFSGGHNN